VYLVLFLKPGATLRLCVVTLLFVKPGLHVMYCLGYVL